MTDLIDENSDLWGEDKLSEVCWPVDYDSILSIPIGSGRQLDRHYWNPELSSNYFVKSGYRLAKVCDDQATSHSHVKGFLNLSGTYELCRKLRPFSCVLFLVVSLLRKYGVPWNLVLDSLWCVWEHIDV